MNILFITSTYLGDAIISSGILESLRLKHPRAKLTVACGPIPAPLFEALPQVDHVIPIQKQSYSRHWLKLWGKCALKKWDIIVDVRGTGISHFLWTKKRYVWKSSNQKDLRVHQLAKFLKLKETPPSKIHLSNNHRAQARSLLEGHGSLICFSPAANWDKKCWPLESFEVLGQKLTGTKGLFPGATIAILGAPSQQKELTPLLENIPNALDLVGKAPLPVLAACLEQSQLFVGNDSGLMHLAASMKTTTLGLFGPSPENIYAPWGKNAHYIRTKTSFEKAMDLAKEGQNIMDEITVDHVIEKIKSLGI